MSETGISKDENNLISKGQSENKNEGFPSGEKKPNEELQKVIQNKETEIRELTDKLEKAVARSREVFLRNKIEKCFQANNVNPDAMEDAINTLLSRHKQIAIDENNRVKATIEGQEKGLEDLVAAFLEKRTWFLKNDNNKNTGLTMDSGRNWIRRDSSPAGISTKEARLKLAGKLFRY